MSNALGFVHTLIQKLKEDKITHYCAYVSFYATISFIPFFVSVLILLGKSIHASGGDIAVFLSDNIPQNIYKLILYLVTDVMKEDRISLLSFPPVTLLWSSSRAITALSEALDCIYNVKSDKGFVKRNIDGLYRTLAFVTAIAVVLTLCGSFTASRFLQTVKLPLTFIVLIGIYTFLPSVRQKAKAQLLGAGFATLGWALFSFAFSLYLEHFTDKSYVYGGLSSLIVLLLWIYFCVMILFIGAEINNLLLCKKV